MATHIVITHEIKLTGDGGPREQASLLAKMETELAAIEKKVIELHGTTVVEAPTRKGPREKVVATAPASNDPPAPVEVPAEAAPVVNLPHARRGASGSVVAE